MRAPAASTARISRSELPKSHSNSDGKITGEAARRFSKRRTLIHGRVCNLTSEGGKERRSWKDGLTGENEGADIREL